MKQQIEVGSLWDLWSLCVQINVQECSEEPRSPRGDSAAETEELWAHLLMRLEPYLLTVLRNRLERFGRRHDAEETLQEVYCRLFDHDRRALRHCRATCDGELLAYLKRICGSVVQDQERARRAQKRNAVLTEASEDIVCSQPSAHEQMRSLELRRRLREECRAVSSCASPSRDVWIFERAVVDGWNSREIADWVDLRQASVDAIVCRMRQRLAERGLNVPVRRELRAA